MHRVPTKIKAQQNTGKVKVSRNVVIKSTKPSSKDQLFQHQRQSFNLLRSLDAGRQGGGKLEESEVINFAEYFVDKMKIASIPWSLNVLDRYYDTSKSKWIIGKQDVQGAMIDMSKVLEKIVEFMLVEIFTDVIQ